MDAFLLGHGVYGIWECAFRKNWIPVGDVATQTSNTIDAWWRC